MGLHSKDPTVFDYRCCGVRIVRFMLCAAVVQAYYDTQARVEDSGFGGLGFRDEGFHTALHPEPLR